VAKRNFSELLRESANRVPICQSMATQLPLSGIRLPSEGDLQMRRAGIGRIRRIANVELATS
jgi:hypothetical protein